MTVLLLFTPSFAGFLAIYSPYDCLSPCATVSLVGEVTKLVSVLMLMADRYKDVLIRGKTTYFGYRAEARSL